MWERCSWYRSRKCIVCGKSSSDYVAPMGIVSGSFPCHVAHSDDDIKDAYKSLLIDHFNAIDLEEQTARQLAEDK